MKAIRFHQPGDLDVLVCDTVPTPECGADDVIIKPEIAGVNFIDTYFRSGLYPATLPMTLGQECGGRVVQVGANVSDLAEGDRVVALSTGSFAERVRVERHRIVKLPVEVDTRTATAALIQGLTALTLTHAAYAVQPGDWVLVHAAAGGTGLMLVQIAKHLGARVIGTTSTKEKAEVALRHGAEHVFLYDEDVVARVLQVTDGAGVQVVYDSVGKSTLDQDFELIARLGTLVSFGQSSGVPDPVPLLRLSAKNIKLLRPSLYHYLTTQAEMEHYTGLLLDMLKHDTLHVNVWRDW
ncbi:NADPH:quinone reductase [Malassezia nana]|uniref:Probable quinone oxidoreductase n=1 Tax=Malassezia nana TaxID=180528 RepID=A0AAF0EMT8_9BASI|nr:NADPH:quinone reductase [Malassezia nana]